MDDKPKIDFQQHVSKRVPRKYLLRIVFYIVMIGMILLFVVNYLNRKEKVKSNSPKVEDVQEINNVTIEN